jgi:hypothetical protein
MSHGDFPTFLEEQQSNSIEKQKKPRKTHTIEGQN